MSDVPAARRMIADARVLLNDASALVNEALTMLHREKPEFKTPAKLRKLTPNEKRRCRELRSQGYSMNDIARRLGTNIGRVSEAINGRMK